MRENNNEPILNNQDSQNQESRQETSRASASNSVTPQNQNRRELAKPKNIYVDKFVLLLPLFSMKKGDHMEGKVITVKRENFPGGYREVTLKVLYAPYGDLPKEVLFALLRDIRKTIQVKGFSPQDRTFVISDTLAEFIKRHGLVSDASDDESKRKKLKEALNQLRHATYVPKIEIKYTEPEGTSQEGSQSAKSKSQRITEILSMPEDIKFIEKLLLVKSKKDSKYSRVKLAVTIPQWLVDNIMNGFLTCIDFNFWKSLGSPLSKRIYELLTPKFKAKFFKLVKEYGKLKAKKMKGIKVVWRYRSLCEAIPHTPRKYLAHAKGKLEGAFKELVDSGFLAEMPEWTIALNREGVPDWYILFTAGERFYEEATAGVNENDESELLLFKELESSEIVEAIYQYTDELEEAEVIPIERDEQITDVVDEQEAVQTESVNSNAPEERAVLPSPVNRVNRFMSVSEFLEDFEAMCLSTYSYGVDRLSISWQRQLSRIAEYVIENEIRKDVVHDLFIKANYKTTDVDRKMQSLIAYFKEYVINNDNLPYLFEKQRETYEFLRDELASKFKFPRNLPRNLLVPAFAYYLKYEAPGDAEQVKNFYEKCGRGKRDLVDITIEAVRRKIEKMGIEKQVVRNFETKFAEYLEQTGIAVEELDLNEEEYLVVKNAFIYYFMDRAEKEGSEDQARLGSLLSGLLKNINKTNENPKS